jgi:hypothetical protein
MTTNVSRKAWLGLAIEGTSGTAESAPDLIIPSKSSFKGVPHFAYQDEDRGTRDRNYDRRYTTREGNGTISGSWYNDTMARLLYLFMGASSPAQPSAGPDPTVWKHTLTLADVPKTATLWKVYDSLAYQLVYSAVNKFKIVWDAKEKVIEAEFGVVHRYPSKVSVPTKPAVSSVKAMPGYSPVIKVDTVATSDIDHLEIEGEQEIEMWWGSGAAAGQEYTELRFGGRTLKASFDARFNAATWHDDLDAGTDRHLEFILTGDTISNTYKQTLEFDLPIFGSDEVEIDTSKVGIEAKVKGTARPGTTANSLFTAYVQNTVADITA